jgi:carboxyl-terminal processing protease
MNDTHAHSETSNSTRLIAIVLALLLAVGTFVAGAKIANSQFLSAQDASLIAWLFGRNEMPAEEVDLSEFWRVWHLMEEKYTLASSTESISAEERIQGAIRGLVGSYDDPYTVYLPPSESEIFEDDISGNFSGVGMEVGLRDGLITIIAPLPETPAEEAGLLPGDVIVTIDERSTEGMSIDEAVRLIRGERGTDVVFSIFRTGALDFEEITVTRDNIVIPTVQTEQIDDVFVISLYSFNAIAESMVADALREYERSDADALIFDVRGNPGGFLQGAVEIASNFLPAGKVVVSERLRDEEEKVFRSRGQGSTSYNKENFVVLVNGGSASASEILAGALRDHGVATIVGETTFGKGSVQELVDLGDGASLKVTVARWLTPNGTSISESGLTPDIIVPLTIEDREADRDPQLDAAVRFLQGETVASEDFLGQFDSTGS